jgi:hypothetical protein
MDGRVLVVVRCMSLGRLLGLCMEECYLFVEEKGFSCNYFLLPPVDSFV